MSREHDGQASLVLMAFVMGSIAGAAVALLTAPTTGKETRRVLNEKVRESRDKAVVGAQRGREFIEKKREHLSTAVDRGREAYQRARDGMTDDAPEEQG